MLANYPEIKTTWDVEQSMILKEEPITALREWTFRPAYDILRCIRIQIPPPEAKPTIFQKRGYFQIHHPWDEEFPGLEQDEQADFILLHELLPDFFLHWWCKRKEMPMYAMDEFMRGLFLMFETNDIPVWLSMVSTCFLDIHHIPGEYVSDAFQQFQELHKHATDTVARFMDLASKSLEQPWIWASRGEENARSFAEFLSGDILCDQTFEYKKHNYCYRQLPFPGESERCYLHRQHPILCGTFATYLTLELGNFGRVVVNEWGTGIFPPHLYNTLRQKKVPISHWPLMEQVIETHGEERVFVGGRPQDSYAWYTQIYSVLGLSSEHFATNRREKSEQLIWSKTGVRRLKGPSPLGNILFENFEEKKGMAFMIHDIEKLLTQQARNTGHTDNTASKSQSRKLDVTKRLTSLQLLHALRECVKAEIPKFQFGYFMVHEQAIKLLQILVHELHGDFLKEFEESYYENERQWPAICKLAIQAGWMTENQDDNRLPRTKTNAWEKIGRIVEFIKTQSESS